MNETVAPVSPEAAAEADAYDLAHPAPPDDMAEALDAGAIADPLLPWYDHQRRDLPWRYQPGEVADPYVVWLSEVMLQQTTVKAVIPYFQEFLARWPTVEALAAAHEDEVLSCWAGLGYYSRARNLHAAAKVVAESFDGRFPRNEKALLGLPGVGPYTAAAIAAIAFDRPVTPVDGNIERVVSRLFDIQASLPGAKPEITRIARALAPSKRSGDFAQALMDLGATICTPKRPSCLMCPLQVRCKAHASGEPESLPRKAPKPERPTRHGIAYVALREDGAVLLRRRPDTGLLARMMEVPSTEWGPLPPKDRQALKTVPVQGNWIALSGDVVHTFTHFRLELRVYHAVVPVEAPLTIWADGSRCDWVARHDLDQAALPSVMRKILALAFDRA